MNQKHKYQKHHQVGKRHGSALTAYQHIHTSCFQHIFASALTALCIPRSRDATHLQKQYKRNVQSVNKVLTCAQTHINTCTITAFIHKRRLTLIHTVASPVFAQDEHPKIKPCLLRLILLLFTPSEGIASLKIAQFGLKSGMKGITLPFLTI